MRYPAIMATLLAAMSFNNSAQADHDLHVLACDYHQSVVAVSEHLALDRYASRYTTMYVARLNQTACDLHEAIKRDPYCPRTIALFEQACSLHNRIDRLMSTTCRSRSPVLPLWRESCALMKQLECAFNAPPVPVAPVISRRATISEPAPVIVAPSPAERYQPSRSLRFEWNYDSRSTTPVPQYVVPQVRTQPQPQPRVRAEVRSTSPYNLDQRRAYYQEMNRRRLSTRSERATGGDIVASVLSGLFN